MSAPTLRLTGAWESLFEFDQRSQVEAHIPVHLRSRRWFAGKARTQRAVTISDAIPIGTGVGAAIVLLVQVGYLDADAEIYLLPVAFATGAEAAHLESESPTLILAHTDGASEGLRGVLYDATGSADFANSLLDGVTHRRTFHGRESHIQCSPTSALTELGIHADTPLAPKLSSAEQSNSAIRFGDRLLLKLFRRPEIGINPDVELGRTLTARRFQNAPPLVGSIEYRAKNGDDRTLGVFHGFVPGAIDGWEYTLNQLGHFYERVRSLGEVDPPDTFAPARLDGTIRSLDREIESLLGAYLESVRLLGRRTAELHLALAEDREDPAFAPEPFTPHYQRGLCESMCNLAQQTLQLLTGKLATLTGEPRRLAAAVIAAEAKIFGRFHRLSGTALTGLRIRIHGDYHLGQTLYTGSDFFIVDFEGEPAMPLSARREKRTPFEDVAGLLRSFDYASNAALRREIEQGAISAAALPRFTGWANCWTRWISTACLESYLARIGTSDILPANVAERTLLLDTHLLRKAVYELGYELNNRPEWLPIPCRGILALINDNCEALQGG